MKNGRRKDCGQDNLRHNYKKFLIDEYTKG